MLIMPNGQPQVAQQSQGQYGQSDFQKWATDRYGRGATQGELDQIGKKVGPTQNGMYSQQQFDMAKGEAEIMARQQGWKGPQQQMGGPMPQGVPPAYQAPQTPFNSGYKPAQFSQFNPQSYQQFQFSQFQAPDQTKQTGQRNQLMDSIMGNVRPFDQQWQDQMFEQQKEQANSMAEQMGLQNQQQLVSRGIGTGGGSARRMERQTQQDLMQNLLAGRRDIATQATGKNREAELAAMGMANDVLNSDMGRALQSYQGTLQGQQLQAGEGRFAQENARNNFLAMLQGQQAQDGSNQFGANHAFQQFMGNEQLKQAAAQGGLQNFLGGQGNMLEWARFNEMQNQFRKTFGLDMMRFGEDQRQFNDQLGLNWWNSQANQQNSALDYFSRFFGG
jgi:hypothetical protein